jgi:hypothetical protein
VPRSTRAPTSEDKAPPSTSVRRVSPATGGKHHGCGVEAAISKPRGVFPAWLARLFHAITDCQVVSLDSVYEIHTTRACLLYPPEARDTIYIRSVPSASVFRGWRSAGRVLEASK